MNNEMTTLIENIKADYLNWTTRCTVARGLDALTEINKKMIAEFNEKITYKVGTKYIKVFTEGGSVWGFVVNTDNDKKFRKGDILKARWLCWIQRWLHHQLDLGDCDEKQISISWTSTSSTVVIPSTGLGDDLYL